MTESTLAEARPEFVALFEAEDRHFWFRARNRVLGSVVGRLTADLAPGYRVLEVGCGTGNVLRVLERVCARGRVTGLDLYEEGLEYARRRTACPLVRADIHAMPFTEPFELIGMFDVLEHLPDDRRVLRDLRAALAPGGRLVLTVPAHASLWSHTDVHSGHHRRYSPGALRQALEDAGFRVERLTQFMMVLYPLVWLGRRLAALFGRRRANEEERNRALFLNELRVVPVVNGVLTRLLAWEAPLLARGHRLPFGASLLAVAVRR